MLQVLNNVGGWSYVLCWVHCFCTYIFACSPLNHRCISPGHAMQYKLNTAFMHVQFNMTICMPWNGRYAIWSVLYGLDFRAESLIKWMCYLFCISYIRCFILFKCVWCWLTLVPAVISTSTKCWMYFGKWWTRYWDDKFETWKATQSFFIGEPTYASGLPSSARSITTTTKMILGDNDFYF